MVNIPIQPLKEVLKWVVHLPQNGTIGFDPQPPHVLEGRMLVYHVWERQHQLQKLWTGVGALPFDTQVWVCCGSYDLLAGDSGAILKPSLTGLETTIERDGHPQGPRNMKRKLQHGL